MSAGIVDFACLDIFKILQEKYPKALWECLCDKDWYGLPDKMFESQNFDEELHVIIGEMFEIRKGHDVKYLRKNDERVSSKPKENRQVRRIENTKLEDGNVGGLLENRIFDDVLPELENLTLGRCFKLSYINNLSIEYCDDFLDSATSLLAQIRSQDIHPVKKRQNLLDAQVRIRVAKNRKMLLETIFTLYKANLIVLPDVLGKLQMTSADIRNWEFRNIKISQRWALYLKVIEQAQSIYSNKVPKFEKLLTHKKKTLEQLYLFAKGMLLQNVQVVGMTTTGAAKYRELVKMMQSKIGKIV